MGFLTLIKGLIVSLKQLIKLKMFYIASGVLISILVFTGLDYVGHTYLTFTNLLVPNSYYLNKVIFGFILGFIFYFVAWGIRYLFFKEDKQAGRIIWVLLVVFGLQARYLFFPASSNYSNTETATFNIVVIILHLITLYIASLFSGLKFGDKKL